MVSDTKNENLRKKLHVIMKKFLLKNNRNLRKEAEDLKFEKGYLTAPSRKSFKELKRHFSKNVDVKKRIFKKQGLIFFDFKHKLSGLKETFEVKIPKEMLPDKKKVEKKEPKKKKKEPKKRNPISKGFKKEPKIPEEHKKHHTKAHIELMKKEMKKGKSFNQAHNIAKKADKKKNKIVKKY